MHFSIYALACSTLAMIVVSLMTTPNTETTLDGTRTGWYIQPPALPSPGTSPGETLFVDKESPRRQ